MAKQDTRQNMQQWIGQMQEQICARLTDLDNVGFQADSWQRPGGGGGVSCVLQDGHVFEKAGVNVSTVHGTLPADALASLAGGQVRTQTATPAFFATGISLVLHPLNPFAPTVHANFRYLELGGDGQEPLQWWFGGGMDLTPAYLFEEDAIHFHRTIADAFGPARHDLYQEYKQTCDTYFYLPHRQETRGIGGVFFEHVCQPDQATCFAWVRQVGEAFLPAYMPIVERRCTMPFTDAERAWQQVRRGRYVEFNLIYDRGTLFGLRTGGRVESILMSLPRTATWGYNEQPIPGSREAQLLQILRHPQDWLAKGT